MFVPAAIARQLHEVVDPHPAGKQSYGQKEADNEHRNHHEHPGHGFDAAHAETLEEAGAECADKKPPHDRRVAADRDVIDHTGHGNQKKHSGGLTES